MGFKEPEAKVFLASPISAKILEVERFTSAQDRFYVTSQRSINKVTARLRPHKCVRNPGDVFETQTGRFSGRFSAVRKTCAWLKRQKESGFPHSGGPDLSVEEPPPHRGVSSLQLFVTSLMAMAAPQQLSGIARGVILRSGKVGCVLFVCAVDAGRL